MCLRRPCRGAVAAQILPDTHGRYVRRTAGCTLSKPALRGWCQLQDSLACTSRSLPTRPESAPGWLRVPTEKCLTGDRSAQRDSRPPCSCISTLTEIPSHRSRMRWTSCARLRNAMELRKRFGMGLQAARKRLSLTQEDFLPVSSRTYLSSLERELKSPRSISWNSSRPYSACTRLPFWPWHTCPNRPRTARRCPIK